MSVLVIAEHDGTSLKPGTFNAVTAAKALDGDIHVLVAGWQCDAVVQAASRIAGVTQVLHLAAPHLESQLAEDLSAAIASAASSYSGIVAPATTFGKNVIPRVGALLDVQPVTDVIAIESQDTFKRPIYAGNVIATVKSVDAIKVITVRITAFDKAPEQGGEATVRQVDAPRSEGLSTLKSEQLAVSERPELTAAKVVVSGGRALGSAENFKMIYDLADKLGAAVGASRAAVDAGFVANDLQVGQTGKIVAPDLYIAIGISGAIQHLAGMQDSRVIVAINKDADAPIFQVADYGLVADIFEAVPELTRKV